MTQVPRPPTTGHLSPTCWKLCESVGVGAVVWCLRLWEGNSLLQKSKTNSTPESLSLFSRKKPGETFSYHDNWFYHISTRSTRVGKSVDQLDTVWTWNKSWRSSLETGSFLLSQCFSTLSLQDTGWGREGLRNEEMEIFRPTPTSWFSIFKSRAEEYAF